MQNNQYDSNQISLWLADSKNEDLKERLRSSFNIDEALVDTYTDSVGSILRELATHSSQKGFYKVTSMEVLALVDLPKVSSLSTHILITLTKRLELRRRVNLEPYKYLYNFCTEIINDIVEYGSVVSPIPNLIKEHTKC